MGVNSPTKLISSSAIFDTTLSGKAGQGVARRGMTRHDLARQGKAGQGRECE